MRLSLGSTERWIGVGLCLQVIAASAALLGAPDPSAGALGAAVPRVVNLVPAEPHPPGSRPPGRPADRGGRVAGPEAASGTPSSAGDPTPAASPEAEAPTSRGQTRDAASVARDREANRRADALLPRPALRAPTTVTITADHPDVSLKSGRDYVVKVKSGTVFSRPVSVTGGRNVVLEHVVITYRAPLGALPGWQARGLLLQDQTGVMWVNDLKLRGPLSEGIDLAQHYGASVVLRKIDSAPVHGSQSTNHADLLQTWAGPGRLVVDGLTGTSDFQGLFLQPADTWDGPDPDFIVLRNIAIDVSRGFYALSSFAHGAYPVLADRVTVKYNPARPSRDQWLWPKPSTGDTTWAKVVGIGPGGGPILSGIGPGHGEPRAASVTLR